MTSQSEQREKLDAATIIKLIDENQVAINECGKEFQVGRAKSLEIAKNLKGAAKKVMFDKKFQFTTEYQAFLFEKLEEIYANHEFFTRTLLMQQHNHLVNTLFVNLIFDVVIGLAKKVPEASEEIAQIKEILKQYSPIMAKVDEQVKITREKNKQVKERNKADLERLQKLQGGTYQ